MPLTTEQRQDRLHYLQTEKRLAALHKQLGIEEARAEHLGDTRLAALLESAQWGLGAAILEAARLGGGIPE